MCSGAKIGFDASSAEKKTDTQCLQAVTADGLEKYVLMRELLGRIGTILVLPPLGLEDYKLLLNTKSGSVGERYRNYLLELYGVQLSVSETAIDNLGPKKSAVIWGRESRLSADE